MTDDLVKRLRANASWGDDRFAEAADRIEALTESRDALDLIASNRSQALILAKEENARLLKIIDAIVDEYDGQMHGPILHTINDARAAINT